MYAIGVMFQIPTVKNGKTYKNKVLGQLQKLKKKAQQENYQAVEGLKFSGINASNNTTFSLVPLTPNAIEEVVRKVRNWESVQAHLVVSKATRKSVDGKYDLDTEHLGLLETTEFIPKDVSEDEGWVSPEDIPLIFDNLASVAPRFEANTTNGIFMSEDNIDNTAETGLVNSASSGQHKDSNNNSEPIKPTPPARPKAPTKPTPPARPKAPTKPTPQTKPSTVKDSSEENESKSLNGEAVDSKINVTDQDEQGLDKHEIKIAHTEEPTVSEDEPAEKNNSQPRLEGSTSTMNVQAGSEAEKRIMPFTPLNMIIPGGYITKRISELLIEDVNEADEIEKILSEAQKAVEVAPSEAYKEWLTKAYQNDAYKEISVNAESAIKQIKRASQGAIEQKLQPLLRQLDKEADEVKRQYIENNKPKYEEKARYEVAREEQIKIQEIQHTSEEAKASYRDKADEKAKQIAEEAQTKASEEYELQKTKLIEKFQERRKTRVDLIQNAIQAHERIITSADDLSKSAYTKAYKELEAKNDVLVSSIESEHEHERNDLNRRLKTLEEEIASKNKMIQSLNDKTSQLEYPDLQLKELQMIKDNLEAENGRLKREVEKQHQESLMARKEVEVSDNKGDKKMSDKGKSNHVILLGATSIILAIVAGTGAGYVGEKLADKGHANETTKQSESTHEKSSSVVLSSSSEQSSSSSNANNESSVTSNNQTTATSASSNVSNGLKGQTISYTLTSGSTVQLTMETDHLGYYINYQGIKVYVQVG